MSSSYEDKQPAKNALSQQKIYDAAPIYTNVFDFSMAAFIPRTIIKIKHQEKNSNLAKNLKEQMEKILSISNEQRCNFLNEMLGEQLITKKECLKYKLSSELVGQKGIYAKKNIKKHTVLGFYSGIYVKNSDDIQSLYQDFSSEQLSLYTFGFSVTQYPYIVGYKYGNKLCLVNGSTTYEGKAEDVARGYCLRNNLLAVYAKSGENPDIDYLQKEDAYDLVAYITERDIKKGEQLFVDYGRRYWSGKIKDASMALEKDVLKFINEYKKKTEKIKKFF